MQRRAIISAQIAPAAPTAARQAQCGGKGATFSAGQTAFVIGGGALAITEENASDSGFGINGIYFATRHNGQAFASINKSLALS